MRGSRLLSGESLLAAHDAAAPPTMRRGSSFVLEYTHPQPELARGPSMVQGPYSDLLPPAPREGYTIVLDLDETVVYAREGPLEVRPHFDEFLTLLDGCCEVIVWTAGLRNYAKAIVRNIDRQNVIAHCIYRHEKWFSAGEYTKDLTLLGRPLDKVLIVENTPDCVRNNPANGVIVQDYEGGAEQDVTLKLLAHLVLDLCCSGLPVPAFLAACPLVALHSVAGSLGEVDVFFLKTRAGEDKTVHLNRDLVPTARRLSGAAGAVLRQRVQEIVERARRSLSRRSSTHEGPHRDVVGRARRSSTRRSSTHTRAHRGTARKAKGAVAPQRQSPRLAEQRRRARAQTKARPWR